MTRLHSELEGR